VTLSATLVLTLVLSVAIGLSLGLLGGGGSILTVPILAYVAGLDAKEAIAASLFVVGVTSAVGVVSHARTGRVRWRTGLLFGGAAMAGAFGGGLLGGFVPGQILMVAFALMMLATAAAMIRGRRGSTEPRDGDLPVLTVIAEGLVVGLVTGIVGAGGGFLVVPALVLLGGLPMSAAVATSLLVIAMKSFAGLAGYLTTVQLDWPLVLAVTGAAVLGSFAGSRLAGVIPENALRRGFGYFVVVMGLFVLVQELPDPAGLAVGLGAAGLAVVSVICWYAVPTCPLRRAAPSPT
jgi:hypothetical protein